MSAVLVLLGLFAGGVLFFVLLVAVAVFAFRRIAGGAAKQATSLMSDAVSGALGAAGGAAGVLSAGVAGALTSGRGLGTGVGNQALGMLLRVGEDELRSGIAFVKKTVDEELLKSDPKRMQMVVAKLAQQHQGELTSFQIMTELDISQRLALDTLQALVQQDVCYLREDGERDVYVFPAFKEKRDVKVCEYCDSTFETDEVGESCKSCGAPGLKVISTI